MSETGRIESFKCPNCGAPIEYDGKGEKTVKCPYCASSATVPEDLLPRQPIRIDVAPSQFTLSPNEARLAKATVATGAGCVLGSILLPIIIVVITGAVILIVFNQAFGKVNDITSSVFNSTNATVQVAINTAKATRTPVSISTPTRAPTPTPGYAVKVTSFGSKGTSPGKLTDARNLGVDAKGNIYVADYQGGRIQVFDSTGQYVSQFKTGNAKSITLGFAVDRKGIVYVVENGVVVRYNGLTGEKLGALAYNGGQGAGFGELATTPDGGLVGMWYERRNGLFTSRDGAREDMVRWDANGKVTLVVQAPIGDQTDNLELDNQPVIDQKGNIYIYASNETAIFKFSSDGKYQSRFGSAGDQPGQFGSANGIAIDSQGMLYVAESARISMFTSDGRFVRQFPVDGSARGIAIDDKDSLYTTDGSTVTKYSLGQ